MSIADGVRSAGRPEPVSGGAPFRFLPARVLRWLAPATLGLAIAAGGAGLALADAGGGRVPKPAITIEKGEKCVADTAVMRRNHMNFLKHQRDLTVHDGVRTPQFSLGQCIECHASREDNRVIGSDRNFCQGCHSYAAVKLDCFECHASKPRAAARLAAATAVPRQTPGGASK